jgi:hypothetical protein
MPGQGVASSFTFGTGYRQIQGLLAGRGIPFELVTPQAWKKLVLAGTTKDKDAAIAYCRRAFPDVALVLPRCRVSHDGIADCSMPDAVWVKKFLSITLNHRCRHRPLEDTRSLHFGQQYAEGAGNCSVGSRSIAC